MGIERGRGVSCVAGSLIHSLYTYQDIDQPWSQQQSHQLAANSQRFDQTLTLVAMPVDRHP